MEQAIVRARKIDGWLSRHQAEALWALARQVPAGGVIVEIGSHHGRSTTILAEAAPAGVVVVAVDPFDDPRWGGGGSSWAVFRSNTSELDVQALRTTSKVAAAAWSGGLVELLFVDGAHDVVSVRADFDGWLPHLSSGASVVFHDAFDSVGVTRALFERTVLGGQLRFVRSVESMAVYENAPPTVRSRAAALARSGYFVRRVVMKVCRRRGWSRLAEILDGGESDRMVGLQ